MEEAKKRLENIENKKQEYQVYITKLNHKRNEINAKKELTDDDALLLIGLDNEIKLYEQRVSKLEYDKNEIKRRMGGGNHNHHGSHKGIIEEYGYDTKHAMHLIRLLHMGLEILIEGDCHVLRPDNNYLLAIRHGKYTLEQIQLEAERLFRLLDDAYVNSKLPKSPDVNKVNELLFDIVTSKLKEDGVM